MGSDERSSGIINFPQYSSNQRRGKKGVRIVDGIISDDLDWIFVPIPQDSDIGIDAHIEVLTEGTAHGTGRLIAAQIKCGSSWLEEKNSEGYVFRGELKHLDYYLNYSLPVLIILCDPSSKECWWSRVSPTAIERTQKAWKITVPFKQKLDKNCLDQLVDISKAGQIGHDAFFWWSPYKIAWHHGIEMVILPIHPEQGKALCMSSNLITNAQYKGLVEEEWVGEPIGNCYSGELLIGPYWSKLFSPWEDPRFQDPYKPVVCVSYWNASLYCDWLHEKYGCYVKLPTPRLWDFAAFGTEFPHYNPNDFLKSSCKIHHQTDCPAVIDFKGERTNPWGIADLLGNVWEWCALDDEGFIGRGANRNVHRHRYSGSCDKNPQLKGGSFLEDLASIVPSMASAQLAEGSSTRQFDIGFRITTEVSVSSLPTDVQNKLKLCKRLLPRNRAYKNPSLYPSDFKLKDLRKL